MMIYPWQQTQWQQLTTRLNREQLPHALLFTGVKGLGKVTFAKAFAHTVLCDNTITEQACGTCRSCTLLNAHTHPDFYDITLEDKSRAIKVDQLRTLTRKLTETASRSGYQVALIHPADTMNRAAANALLKTLEEPQGNVLIILIADRISALPATILSRCQRVHFSANNMAVEWLRTQCDASTDAALLLRCADNAPLQALHLAQSHYLTLRNQLLDDLMHVRQGTLSPCDTTTRLKDEDVPLVLRCLLSVLTDTLRIQMGVDSSKLINTDLHGALQRLSALFSADALLPLIDKINTARTVAASAINVNVPLLLDDVFIAFLPQPGGAHAIGR